MTGPLAFALLLAGATFGQALSPFQQLRAEDRDIQRAGAQALVASCDGCTPHLLGIWRTTERFDVRAHIALILERLGPEGIGPLVELTADLDVAIDPDQRALIVRALAPSGPAAMEALIGAIEAHPDKHASAFVQPLISHLEIDPAPSVHRLIASPDPRVRKKACYGPIDLLPEPDRSITALALARDPDQGVRLAIAVTGLMHRWTDAERAAHPNEYAVCMVALTDLVASNDDPVIRAAAASIRENPGAPPGALPALRTVASNESRAFWARVEAMRAILAIHPDRAAAIIEVAALLDSAPGPVCIALADVSTHEFPEALIPRLVALAPATNGREENYAIDLLAKLGDRSTDAAIAALADADTAISGSAAAVIARLGPVAARAEPALLDRLAAHPTGWQGEAYVRALLAIGADSPATRAALTALIIRDSTDPMDVYVSGNALRDLMHARGDEAWVRELAEPVVTDPAHPLREWLIIPADPNDSAPLVPVDTPAVAEADHLILYGEGDAPQRALRSLGIARPITPDIILTIRDHLSDPRGSMRAAAIRAAGAAEAAAFELIDDLLALAQRSPDLAHSHDIAEALLRIAPDDPRVVRFRAEYQEVIRRGRTQSH